MFDTILWQNIRDSGIPAPALIIAGAMLLWAFIGKVKIKDVELPTISRPHRLLVGLFGLLLFSLTLALIVSRPTDASWYRVYSHIYFRELGVDPRDYIVLRRIESDHCVFVSGGSRDTSPRYPTCGHAAEGCYGCGEGRIRIDEPTGVCGFSITVMEIDRSGEQGEGRCRVRLRRALAS